MMGRKLIVDCHCHAGFGQAMTAPWTTHARIEVTLKHMAKAGIDKTVVFPVNDAEYQKPNQTIAELCGRYPGKLTRWRVDGLGRQYAASPALVCLFGNTVTYRKNRSLTRAAPIRATTVRKWLVTRTSPYLVRLEIQNIGTHMAVGFGARAALHPVIRPCLAD